MIEPPVPPRETGNDAAHEGVDDDEIKTPSAIGDKLPITSPDVAYNIDPIGTVVGYVASDHVGAVLAPDSMICPEIEVEDNISRESESLYTIPPSFAVKEVPVPPWDNDNGTLKSPVVSQTAVLESPVIVHMYSNELALSQHNW